MQAIGLGHPAVRRARDLIHSRIRNPRRFAVVEGIWAHRLLIEREIAIDTFLYQPSEVPQSPIAEIAARVERDAARSYQVSAKTMLRLSERTRPDGLVSIVELPRHEPSDIVLPADALIVVADGLEIAGNLGTLLRTADAAGVAAVVLTNRKVRLTHPKVLRASQGAVFTVPVLELSEDEALSWLRGAGFHIALASAQGAGSYSDADYARGRTAFVVGAEKYGLSPAWRQAGLDTVQIPMAGSVDSLNVAISAAILLFGARAAQRAAADTEQS